MSLPWPRIFARIGGPNDDREHEHDGGDRTREEHPIRANDAPPPHRVAPRSEITWTASAGLSYVLHSWPMPKTGNRSQMSVFRGSAGFDGTLPESCPAPALPGPERERQLGTLVVGRDVDQPPGAEHVEPE